MSVAHKVTLKGLIFARINFHNFCEIWSNSQKYVFAKSSKKVNSGKIILAEKLNRIDSRK